MRIDVITLFPDMFEPVLSQSIIGRAQKKGIVTIHIHNLRNWTHDKHRTVDDKPFGGGVGMVMMPEPIFEAIEDITSQSESENLGKPYIIYTSPQGKILTQEKARTLSQKPHVIILCGRYEGVDQRVLDDLIDEEISIGDYILTGGELPAMVLADAIVRIIPGVLEKKEATNVESFTLSTEEGKMLLEPPQYTRPAEFRGKKVPEILLSGDHKNIIQWKKEKSYAVTQKKRPDLLE